MVKQRGLHHKGLFGLLLAMTANASSIAMPLFSPAQTAFLRCSVDLQQAKRHTGRPAEFLITLSEFPI